MFVTETADGKVVTHAPQDLILLADDPRKMAPGPLTFAGVATADEFVTEKFSQLLELGTNITNPAVCPANVLSVISLTNR
jgi:hypothetical protein